MIGYVGDKDNFLSFTRWYRGRFTLMASVKREKIPREGEFTLRTDP